MRILAANGPAHQRLLRLFPGIAACGTVALAAAFLAEHYGAPTILFALLLGMALQSLSEHERMIPGIRFTSSTVLRFGVALLGARITTEQITAIRHLKAQGERISAIARIVHLSRLTVYQILAGQNPAPD